uniref:Interleukin 3 receptor subunit alpha n=1 Tax=Cebus imitator TaxID=2715852 RepID=A0A2K5QQV6_CEBIM
MVLLWLTLLLMPGPGLLQTNHMTNPPIKNLRMEAKTQTLTWDVDGNVTGIRCKKGPDYGIDAMNDRYCQFEAISLCEVTNYSVTAASGNSRAAAQNLSCRVHEVDLMTCSWAVGPEAPGDIQYHLSISSNPDQEQHPCVHYNTNERGTHTGCVFSDISGISRGSPAAFILVRGSSEAFRVPCIDQHVMFWEIGEWPRPPRLLTASCQLPRSWDPRHGFHRGSWDPRHGCLFSFKPQVKGITSFQLLNPGTYTVRIRAQETYDQFWSAWSSPQRFECGQEEGPHTRAWRTSLFIVLGTLLALLCAVLLCRRYLVMERLFPRIPHMKDPMGDGFRNDNLVVWEAGRAGLEECRVTEIQVVEKT